MKIEQLLQFSSNRYRFGSHFAQCQNNTIPILKYPGKCDNIFLAQMIRIGTDFFEKFCLIPVINTVNYFVDFYMSFILLLF